MEIKVRSAHPFKCKTPCLVVGVLEGKFNQPLLKELDEVLDGLVARIVRAGEFSGKVGETLLLHTGASLPVERVVAVGLGKEKGLGAERLRQMMGTAAAFLQARHIDSCLLDLSSLPGRKLALARLSQAVVEGALLGSYRFDRYRTENGKELPPPLAKLGLLVGKRSEIAEAEAGVAQAEDICAGVVWARDMVNEPGNVKSPDYLAEQAQQLAREMGMHCTCLEQEEMERLGMNALLGVAQGSVRGARLIVLEYRGGGAAARPIVLVGKGVVFDAGGLSLKPSEKMDEMKMDMAGGAAVLGTLRAAAALKLPLNLVGIVPAVENLPSGSAIRPGDILTTLSGKTIEVLNTDAEGRLILADALAYAKRFEPRVVIDVATLTGACIVALGHQASAVLGNHTGLVRQLIKAGEASGERLWQLPLWDEYANRLKSDVADVKNIGGRPAGTITAAAFLQKFAEEFTWAHIDIAGTAWEEKGRPCIPKGGTGVGVRLLVEYLTRSCGDESGDVH